VFTLANADLFAGGGGGGFFKLLLTGGGGGCFLTLFVVDVYELLVLLNFALPIEGVFDLAGEEERSSYVCLSGELWTEEFVLSAKTSVLTGRRLRCEGNGGGAPWSDPALPILSDPMES
jgi:hypothetical protein